MLLVAMQWFVVVETQQGLVAVVALALAEAADVELEPHLVGVDAVVVVWVLISVPLPLDGSFAVEVVDLVLLAKQMRDEQHEPLE